MPTTAGDRRWRPVAARHCPRRRLGGVVGGGKYPRGASGALVAAWARPWADCWTGPGPVLGRGPAALHEKTAAPRAMGGLRPRDAERRRGPWRRIARRPRPYRYLATAPCSAATPGGVVGDHAGGLPSACEHGFGG